jgi:tRNA threonylcarbamoyl adenosine modification protein YeaZ
MYSLLIDSHGAELNIVLFKDKGVLSAIKQVFNNQSKIIVPKILELLSSNHVEINELTEIIVVNGPGSFTGVRLGVTIAKTLAYSLNIPIKSISTIKLLAINAQEKSDYSIALPDQKGFFIGEFNNNNKLVNDYFYLTKDEYLGYKDKHKTIQNSNIDWNNIYKYDCLNDEDCYNIKPLYIKKIEVEK